MGIIKPAPSAHPFAAVMFNGEDQLNAVLETLKNRFGTIMSAGPVYWVTDFTDYYVKEFGDKLQKQFFVFQNPVSLENYYETKVWTNELEQDSQAEDRRRFVNIDPGYLEPSKLVLYSSKNFSHRTYCGSGIYAEVTMLFAHGDFVRLPWTYDDYYWEENRRFLLNARKAIVQRARNNL